MPAEYTAAFTLNIQQEFDSGASGRAIRRGYAMASTERRYVEDAEVKAKRRWMISKLLSA